MGRRASSPAAGYRTAGASSATDVLLEREVEAARLAAAVEGAAAGRGAVVVIEGAAGLGKTRLLRHAAELASSSARVLTASGSELEHEFGFGVVRQLFERAAAEAGLEGAAALAAPALGHASDASGDRFASLHGLYWLVANLSSSQPLLLTVDDAQWADGPSLRFLAYLARRVGELPVTLLLASRPPLPDEDRSILEAIAAEAQLLAPAPLSESAIATLAGPTADPAFVTAVHHATAGNALLVEELLAEARETHLAYDMHTTRIPGSDPGIRDAYDMHTSRTPGSDPGVRLGYELDASVERIGRRVARRLAGLGEAAAPLAGAVAVLGDGVEVEVAARLAGVAVEDARVAAAELVAADLFEDARTLRFRHPLIRTAVAERLPAVELGQAHADAARLLAALGKPPGAVAAHLLAAPPTADGWAHETLRAAAHEACGQGTPELAAIYLRRVLQTPVVGRAGADEHVALLVELGRAEHAAGSAEGPGRLRAAWELSGDGQVAFELVSMLAEQTRWAEGAAVGREALRRTHDRELDLRLQTAVADCVRMDPSTGGDEPERLIALAKTLNGDTPAERRVLATAALITPVDTAAEHARAALLVHRAAADGSRVSVTGVVSNLIRAGRLDDAERIAEEVLASARAAGLIQRHALMLSMRGWISLERGNLVAAREDLEAALELGPQLELPATVVASAAAMLALVVAEQGELERADDLLTAHGLQDDLPEHQVMNLLLHFRSRIRGLQGRPDDALSDAQGVGRRYERLGIRRAVPPWRSTVAILTDDEALAREERELAERWGTPLAKAQAHRGLGLITHDTHHLQRAAELLEKSPHRLELARARVDLGAAQRRAGQRAQAREPLRQGMDAAHACGARPLADRARTELLATGARPRRLALQGTDALTPSEQRVANLAATGLTNRQIAQELFVTAATVDTHLRHVFQKLDIKSRGQLTGAISR
ncbi:AAA family ATPase [Solirubrobacter ginsenosidimutans]|uniref:AAA family ATPase n=1 Tax=Solirubrobacter ginsenosidimutans TaxID=490573 RepID=A0A9X3MRA5_9ACTN|nr:AAA family ATPase [Solirubrobacter ginsenosidimutans]